jgi:hypothetical protein
LQKRSFLFSITLIKCFGKDQLENIILIFCYGWPNRNLPSCDNNHYSFGVINLNTPDMIACLVTNTDMISCLVTNTDMIPCLVTNTDMISCLVSNTDNDSMPCYQH